MTSEMLVQCSTNWDIKPTASWSRCDLSYIHLYSLVVLKCFDDVHGPKGNSSFPTISVFLDRGNIKIRGKQSLPFSMGLDLYSSTTTYFSLSLTWKCKIYLEYTCFCTHRNSEKEKWYKFNDTIVEEFDMNEDTLEAECFGGTYKATVYDTGEMSYIHTWHT